MGRGISKKRIVRELSKSAGVSMAAAARVLDALAEIVYREAARGVIVPGLCKFEVADRKPRRCRDPRTGTPLIIGAHKGVKVRPVKKAKTRIAPLPPGIVTVAEPPRANPEPEPAPEASVASPLSVSINCVHCRSEVDVPAEKLGQEDIRCPWCAQPVSGPREPQGVPVSSSPPAATNTGEMAEAAKPPEPTQDDGEFVYFRCDACGQEIEAPADMAGMAAACPACGAPVHVPRPLPATLAVSGTGEEDAERDEMDDLLMDDLKRRTIRIHLPTEFSAAPAPAKKKVIIRRTG